MSRPPMMSSLRVLSAWHLEATSLRVGARAGIGRVALTVSVGVKRSHRAGRTLVTDSATSFWP